MIAGKDCCYYFNSLYHLGPPEGFPGEWIDLAADPSAAHQVLRLGISPRSDLPAVTVEEGGGKLRLLGLRLTPDEAVRLASGESIPIGDLRIYGTAWCAECQRAKEILGAAGVRYDEVDLDQDPTAEARVLARSGGRRVVPTLLFDDRLWLFNPAPGSLQRFVAADAGATVA